MKCVIYILFLYLCFPSITNEAQWRTIDKKDYALEELHVDNRIRPEDQITDLFSVEKIIPLESAENAYFKYIRNLKIRNDTIYIMGENTVIVFNKNGDFIKTIGVKGRGPDELILPMDFTLVPNNSELMIWDSNRNQLNHYTFDGEIISRYYPPVRYILQAQYIRNSFSLLFTYLEQFDADVSYSVYGYNTKQNTISGLINFPKLKSSLKLMDYNYLSIYNYKYYVRLPVNDTIYRLNQNNKLNPEYVIKFKKDNTSNLPVPDSKNPAVLKSSLQKEGICLLSNFEEFNDYYYLIYERYNERFIHLIGKHSDIQKRYLINTKDDMFGSCIPTIRCGDFLIGVIKPHKLLQDYSGYINKQHVNKDMINSVISNLDINDNQLLVFFKIKKDL